MERKESKLGSYDVKIVNYLRELKTQRDEIALLVEQQKKEKLELETELEKIVYKLKTLDKSITQRHVALENYDTKIRDAEEKYYKIVQRSESLLCLVRNGMQELENLMDKRIGTNNNED